MPRNASLNFGVWGLGSLALFASLLCAVPVQAQVTISPLVIELQAERGQAKAVINVGNNTNEPFRARVYAEPFTYSRDNGFQTLTSSPSDLTPYLRFSPIELNVPPGVTRRVRLISRFPPSLAEGEYRAVIFTENLEEITQGNNQVAIATRIGVTVYVRQGDLSPNLAVESASWNLEQKQIQILVHNSGKASVRPAVNWTLKRGETVVETGSKNPTAIIAQSDRNILLEYPGEDQPALAPGEYQITGELVWGNQDNPNTQPFSVNLTIGANSAASSPSSVTSYQLPVTSYYSSLD